MFTFPITMMSSDGSYTITNALMLDGAADLLTKSFSGSGNRNTYTRSLWIKRSKLGAQMRIFDTGPDGGNNTESLYFGSNDNLYWGINDSNAVKYQYQTAQVFRDTTAWYHIVVARDTATVKMYVNGDEITNFATTPTNTGASNVGRWTHTDQNVIGKYFLNASDFLGGYLAEVIQVDGSILTPASFGEENSDGVWVPIEPPASLGTNGFHLDFESADIGNDVSGNNNDFTPSSMGANNVVVDTCTDSSNTDVTLFPCLDPNNKESSLVLSSANLKAENDSASNWQSVLGTIGLSSGRYYWEITRAFSGHGYDTWGVVGDGKVASDLDRGSAGAITFDTTSSSIRKYDESTSAASYYASGTGSASGDVIGVDLDVDNDTIELIVGGTGRGTLDISGLAKPLFPVSMIYTGGSVDHIYNFGASSYTHTKPSGASNITQTITGVGNYWTLNPLASTDTLTNGNLSYTGAANFSSYVTAPALPMTGKWYWEIKAVGSAPISASANYDTYVGVVKTSVAIPTASHTSDSNLWVWGNPNPASDSGSPAGTKYNGSGTSLPPTSGFGDNSIIMIAVDMDNSKIWFGNDGTWAGSSSPNPATGSDAAFDSSDNSFGSHQVMPFQSLYSDSATYNFGATAFTYTPPTGFKALNTANLPAPTVTDPGKYFKAIDLGAGNDGTRSVTGVGFAPDLVWIKSRSGTYEFNHQLFDVVRGDSNPNTLQPNLPDAQTNGELHTTSGFDTDGFTLVHDASILRTNSSAQTYVAWCMKAGGSPSTIEAGSISTGVPTIASSVSTADHGGFSIGTFTAGANGAITIGHGLTRDIGMLWVKDRAASGGWWVWSDQLGNTAHYLRLDANGGTATDGGTNVWNGVHPGASSVSTGVFSTKDNGDWLTNGNAHVFYAFARTPGLIAMGSFKGANATDGNHIFMDDGSSGFKPAWFMFKNLSGNGSWYIVDSARNPTNIGTAAGTAKLVIQEVDNESTVHSETSNGIIDFVANGVKFRGTNGSDFQGDNTFLYLAFAEDPFGGSGVAQARAR